MARPDLPSDVLAPLLSFYCPLAAEINPDAEVMRERTLAWAERFDLGKGDRQRTWKLALTGTTFMANTYPHAAGEVGQALFDYSAWGWVPNDLVESGRPVSDVVAL